MDAGIITIWDDDGVRPRNHDRLSCSVLCDLRADGLRPIRIRLCDLSPTGFMAECHERVTLGGTVSIDLPAQGTVHARVRWSMGGRIGGRFTAPIDLAACRAGIAEATRTS